MRLGTPDITDMRQRHIHQQVEYNCGALLNTLQPMLIVVR
jgi:hypothetical protein